MESETKAYLSSEAIPRSQATQQKAVACSAFDERLGGKQSSGSN